MNDYKRLTEGITKRLNPDNRPLTISFSAELTQLSYSDVLVYVRSAMKAVDPHYTQITKEAGEKVKQHLRQNLNKVSFRYQGSVMTNTHIRGLSDIDLLTISERFYTWDKSSVEHILNNNEQRNTYGYNSVKKLEAEARVKPYTGDSLNALREIRAESERTLSTTYDICDITKPKSIAITNKHLNREVDVVVANWHDDVKSIINDRGEYRGIQIYNKDLHKKENTDYPFLSIARINQRSSDTNGRLKRMIRFMKNCKSFDQDCKISSFDINAIVYDIPIHKYANATFYELVPIIYFQLEKISQNSNTANNLTSVDGKEYIFRNNPDKLDDLRRLVIVVAAILRDLRSVQTLQGIG